MKVSEIFQVETAHAPGNLASVLNVIAEAGLVLEHVSTVRRDQHRTLWELTVEMDESVHNDLLTRLNALPSARFVGWSDRAFDRHRGGKIEMRSRVAISTQQMSRAWATSDCAPDYLRWKASQRYLPAWWTSAVFRSWWKAPRSKRLPPSRPVPRSRRTAEASTTSCVSRAVQAAVTGQPARESVAGAPGAVP